MGCTFCSIAEGSLWLNWAYSAYTICTLTLVQLHYKKVDLQHRQELWHQHVLSGRLRGNIVTVTRHCANRPRRGRTCARTTAPRRTGSQPEWTKFPFKFSSIPTWVLWPQIPALYLENQVCVLCITISCLYFKSTYKYNSANNVFVQSSH